MAPGRTIPAAALALAGLALAAPAEADRAKGAHVVQALLERNRQACLAAERTRWRRCGCGVLTRNPEGCRKCRKARKGRRG